MRIIRDSNRATRLGAVVMLVMLIGCSQVTVSTSASPTADFATRHTYAWEPNQQMGGSLDASIAGQDIHQAVNQTLEAPGFRPVTGEPADFLVDYRVMLQREMQIEGGRFAGVSSYNYTEGSLIVALVDPKTDLVLWRGDAQGVVDPSGGSKQSQDIQTAVQRMFANFPS